MHRNVLSQDRGITIPLVMPQSVLERLNALALERGCNRSALVREAIDTALFNRCSGHAAVGRAADAEAEE